LHEYFEDGTLELYNLDKDVGEKQNLASQFPEKVKEMHLLLQEWRTTTGAPLPRGPNPDYDPAFEKQDDRKRKQKG
jgi:hypothetical protein